VSKKSSASKKGARPEPNRRASAAPHPAKGAPAPSRADTPAMPPTAPVAAKPPRQPRPPTEEQRAKKRESRRRWKAAHPDYDKKQYARKRAQAKTKALGIPAGQHLTDPEKRLRLAAAGQYHGRLSLRS
jgi:hypothetical protein